MCTLAMRTSCRDRAMFGRDEGQDGPGGNGEQVIENLSVDDTNKLREKLGRHFDLALSARVG